MVFVEKNGVQNKMMLVFGNELFTILRSVNVLVANLY